MPQRILLRLTQDFLIVANTGKPFAERSLIAVCNSDTDKDTNDPLQEVESGTSDPAIWLSAILNRKRAAIQADPSLLRRFRRNEKQTKDDYRERVILELLQNAIDAGRDRPIGNKGRGFRSLLNIADEIEVHSGELHLRWSDMDARCALGDLAKSADQLPVLDLPGLVQPSDETKSLLLAGDREAYQTVLRLKLTGPDRSHIHEEWSKFASDPSLLLFIDGEIEVKWHSEEACHMWRRHQSGEFVTVTVEESSQHSKQHRWRVFQSGHARAAYAVDENNKFQKSGVSAPRLRSFFPASLSAHPFPNLFLHHGKFVLQSNRESVSLSDTHLGEIAQTMLQAARSVETQSELLDLIHVGSFEDHDQSRSDSHVWESAKAVFKDAPLAVLGERKLSDIKICPKEDVLPFAWRGENRLKNWEAFLTALKQQRPAGLNDLPVLKPGVENTQREATILKFHPTCSFTSDQLRALEWAPVEMSPEPVSSFTFKVFLPHKGEPFDSPSGFEVRFLSKAFLDACGLGLESFLTETLGVLKFSASSVVKHAVLPVLTANQTFEPNSAFIQFLRRLRDADQAESKKPVESFDWSDPVRRELIQKLHIWCQGRSWPVLQIYAGEKWTGNRFLEATFSDQRGFLDIDPHADQKQRELEENFWKWLGVAWCPKVLPVLKDIIVEKQHGEGLTWVNGRFQGHFFHIPQAPEGWSEYCSALRGDVRFTGWSYFPRLKANWTIDGGTSALAQVGAFGVIAKHWPTYRGWLRAKIGCSTNAQIDHDNRSNSELSSHLAWLFQATKWVPCAGGLHCGSNVFQPSGAVAKELIAFVPRLDLPEKETESTQMVLPPEFLNACGIRNGWKEVSDNDWILWLEQASKIKPNVDGLEEAGSAIRGLYTALLKHRRMNPNNQPAAAAGEPLKAKYLWSIECNDNSPEEWHLIGPNEDKPFFVDRPDVADVNLSGLRTFPVRLGRGLVDKARQHLDLRPLSEALSGVPTEQGREKPEFASTAADRLNELMAYLQLDVGYKDDSELQRALESVTLRESTSLKVQFSVDDKPMGGSIQRSKFQHFDKEAQRWIVFVDRGCREDERWEAFAEALLLSSGSDTGKALNVRELLRCKADCLHERMIKLDVAPETVEALRKKRDERDEKLPSAPALQPKEEAAPQATPQEHLPESLGAISAQPPAVEESAPLKRTSGGERSFTRSSERNPRQPPDGQRNPSSRPHPQEGIKAQKWLFDQVEQWCEENEMPPPEWEKDRNDITIQNRGGWKFIIEAKRIDGSTIHWTRNQIDQAKKAGGYYVIALLRPVTVTGDHRVFWVRKPLEVFLSLERQVEWTWQVKEKAQFVENSWEAPAERPLKPADSFNAEIKIDESWLQDLLEGMDKLTSIINEANT